MAVAIHVFIKSKGASDDDFIGVEHVFYGRDEAEADKIRLAHLAGCENFAAAEADNRTAEDLEDVEDRDVPTWAEVGFDEGAEDCEDEDDEV
jgi:hypothetical protein